MEKLNPTHAFFKFRLYLGRVFEVTDEREAEQAALHHRSSSCREH